MGRNIRLATVADAPTIQAIYAPIVRESATSFELDPPTVPEMEQRIAKTLIRWPWLVCVQDDVPVGYAYASQHRERAAYQWATDVSVYIHAQWRGQGIARALYQALFTVLRAQGYCQVFAGIALPNPGSVALHEALGMRPLGIYRQVGYKLGAWHDVGWWQGTLQPLPASPQPPQPITALQHSPTWASLELS
jgi:L-amino acid N-acyltransferase YncA